MQEIESIRIRRDGAEGDLTATVVLEIQDIHGDWFEIGRELLDSNFCSAWNLPVRERVLVNEN